MGQIDKRRLEKGMFAVWCETKIEEDNLLISAAEAGYEWDGAEEVRDRILKDSRGVTYRFSGDKTYSCVPGKVVCSLNYADLLLPETDNVNHPAHYTQGGIECIDAIKAAITGLNGIIAHCVGNAIKYIWRFSRKNGIEDIDKAIWYLERLKKEVEGTE